MDAIAFGLIPIPENFCNKITAFLQQLGKESKKINLGPEIIGIKKGKKPNEIVFQFDEGLSISTLVFQRGEHFVFVIPHDLHIYVYECRISEIVKILCPSTTKSP